MKLFINFASNAVLFWVFLFMLTTGHFDFGLSVAAALLFGIKTSWSEK